VTSDGKNGAGNGGGDAPAAAGPSAEDTAAWEAPVTSEEVRPEEALCVDIEGFSGPLDLLLALARTHKIDLAHISILALVEQYLNFIAEAKRVNLEVAADYLVMAAWLAFLKSRLLLPKEKSDDGGPSGDELKALLHHRLMRLDAMRKVAAQLMTRKRLGQDIFYRGQPETVRTVRETIWTADIYDLLKAYADQRRRTIRQVHVVKKRVVWSIKEARRQLEMLVGRSTGEWVQLDLFLNQYLPPQPAPAVSRSVLASSFGATLEMAREGLIELRQDQLFGPIHMRRAPAGGQVVVVPVGPGEGEG
jgi:segregation and condensation protein A